MKAVFCCAGDKTLHVHYADELDDLKEFANNWLVGAHIATLYGGKPPYVVFPYDDPRWADGLPEAVIEQITNLRPGGQLWN
jgi:hypothetical protein